MKGVLKVPSGVIVRVADKHKGLRLFMPRDSFTQKIESARLVNDKEELEIQAAAAAGSGSVTTVGNEHKAVNFLNLM